MPNFFELPHNIFHMPNFFELPHDIFHMPIFFHSICFIKKKSIELFKIYTIIQSQFYYGSYDLST